MNSRAVAWMDGCWGEPQQLTLPLSDRGLLLADGLFETVLVLDGQPQLLEAHLERWQRSAMLLAMAAPPDIDALQPLINEAINRAGLAAGSGALRLNWSRGDGQGEALTCRMHLHLTASGCSSAPTSRCSQPRRRS